MKYVAFFAILIPLQLMPLVVILRWVRKRRPGGETDSWMALTGKLFLLMMAVNVVALIPGIGMMAVVIWLVGLMRLSGLDVLSTFILSFCLGIVNLAGMITLARYLELRFPGA